MRCCLITFYPQQNYFQNWSQSSQTLPLLYQLSFCNILNLLLSFQLSSQHLHQEQLPPEETTLLVHRSSSYHQHLITRLQALLYPYPPKLTGCSLANAFVIFFSDHPLDGGSKAGLSPLTSSSPTLISCFKSTLVGNSHLARILP